MPKLMEIVARDPGRKWATPMIDMWGVAPGLIVSWNILNTPIPDGWLLCDGTSGTPDLRVKFSKGVGFALVLIQKR